MLEIGSGGGQGVFLLSQKASSVIASDIDEKNLSFLLKGYSSHEKIIIKKLDAENIDLPENSVDVLIAFEIIYYLSDIYTFLNECKRVLRDEGVLIISSANKEWFDFNPSGGHAGVQAFKESFKAEPRKCPLVELD